MTEDDSVLLKAARRGDEKAFLALYQRHRTSLYRFAWRLIGSVSAAEDVIQECFLVVLNGAAFDSDQGSLRGYLFGIARNLALKKLRVDGRECEETEETEAAPSQLDNLLKAERAEAVARAVGLLPPLQREALILFEYEDLTLDEIARITGIDTGAVKARLHRARETLRHRLAPLMKERTQRGLL